MADNTVLNAGSGGDTIATDDVGGVKYQVVKLDVGGDGLAAPVGDSNPLPVSDAGGSLTVDGTVAVSGTVTVDASGTAVPVTDNAGSLTVDNAGTFAVQAAQSGTWNVTNVSGTVSLPTGAATAAKQPALGTAGTASADVITVQGIASMTALKVDGSAVTQPVSGTVSITANSAVNVAQINGTAVTMGAGVSGTGVQRVVIATDQPQLTNKLLVTPDANSAINVAQIGGVTTLKGNGVTGTGSLRVTIASDNTAFTVNAAQSGTWTVQPGNTANTTAWLTSLRPGTSGGLSVATGTIGATKTSVKASAGQVFGWYVFNPNSTVAYVQIFDVASASITLGTTAPTYSIGIPAGAAANVFSDVGIAHATAIVIAITTTRAGSTGPSSTVDYNIFYA